MLTANVTDIVARARAVSDSQTPTPGTDFVTDSELYTELTSLHRRFLDIVISADGGPEMLMTSTVLTAPTYALPADFYRAYGLDAPGPSNNRKVSLQPFNWQDRNQYYSQQYPRWRVESTKIVLEPSDALPLQPLTLWYVPFGLILNPTGGLGASTTVLSVDGWEDFHTYGLATYIAMKEDRETSGFLGLQKEAEIRIKDACRRFVPTDTRTIANVESMPEEILYGWWHWG